MNRMPDHITDGPQTPEDVIHDKPERDPDEAYDEERQRRLDEGLCHRCGNHHVRNEEDICGECQTEEAEFIFDCMMDR